MARNEAAVQFNPLSKTDKSTYTHVYDVPYSSVVGWLLGIRVKVRVC